MTDFREALATAVRSALFTTDAIWQYGHPKQLAMEERLDRMTASLAPGIIAALPASIREAVDLGLAWQEAVAAAAEKRGRVDLADDGPGRPGGRYVAAMVGPFVGRMVEGDTPAAALRALAAKLKEQR